jgi:uncharacterized protein (TIGR02270 family)
MVTFILPVVSQHAEEAAFLWLLRDAAVARPHYSLLDLTRLDERAEAHLDGLRIARDPGWEICAEAMAEGDAGAIFAAGVLAFESGHDERIRTALKAGTASAEKARGLVSALGWLSFSDAEIHINRLLAADVWALRRVGIGAGAVHRRLPMQSLFDGLSASEPLLRARALRAVGELGLADGQSTLRKNYSADDPACRFWANWSSALLTGDPQSVANLQAVAEAKGPFQERALQMALRRLDLRVAKAWQMSLAENAGQLRLAIIAAGVIGDPELVPWLIEQTKVKPLARVAGEALSMITGVDLAYQDLNMRPPENIQAGPTESPEDENVAMDPDDNLPWPKPEAVEVWWKDHKGEFTPRTRYLMGSAMSPESLQRVLRQGYQRQRAAAALELALLQKGQPLFEVRAPGFRQQKCLP